MPNAGPSFSTGRELANAAHTLRCMSIMPSLPSQWAQPMSPAPSQLPACRLHPLLYVLELGLLSMSHWFGSQY